MEVKEKTTICTVEIVKFYVQNMVSVCSFTHSCSQQILIEHLLCGSYHDGFHGAESLNGERDTNQ